MTKGSAHSTHLTWPGTSVVQKTHVAIAVDRAYKPHFCADGEVRRSGLAFTRRRSSPIQEGHHENEVHGRIVNACRHRAWCSGGSRTPCPGQTTRLPCHRN